MNDKPYFFYGFETLKCNHLLEVKAVCGFLDSSGMRTHGPTAAGEGVRFNIWQLSSAGDSTSWWKELSMWNEIKGNFIPGDLAVIVDDSATRKFWILGRTLRMASGEKGVRAVLI